MTEAGKRPVGRPSSRERILEAAHDIVTRHGTGHLTYESLAERTGISRGGILYNFPTKDALLKGMIDRYVQQVDEGKKNLRGNSRTSLLALIDSRLSQPRINSRGAASMLAAMSENPSLLEPIAQAMLRDADAVRAERPEPTRHFIAWLALEGLLFQELFGTSPLKPDERDKVVALIRKIAQAD